LITSKVNLVSPLHLILLLISSTTIEPYPGCTLRIYFGGWCQQKKKERSK
jgi:hypothetical protein